MTLAFVPSGRRTPTLRPARRTCCSLPAEPKPVVVVLALLVARAVRPGEPKLVLVTLVVMVLAPPIARAARSLPLRAPPARPSQGRWWRRLWWWSSCAAVFDPSGWNRPATASRMLQISCFKCFIGMLQVFHMDVAKENQNVACIAMVVHISCKLLFPMFIYFFRHML
jgi:hypothetical protein